MSHISIILSLYNFSINIILNKMYSTCFIMMTLTPYIRLYTVDPSINICDNISDCTYQKSEVCMSVLIYTLLQLHVSHV